MRAGLIRAGKRERRYEDQGKRPCCMEHTGPAREALGGTAPPRTTLATRNHMNTVTISNDINAVGADRIRVDEQLTRHERTNGSQRFHRQERSGRDGTPAERLKRMTLSARNSRARGFSPRESGSVTSMPDSGRDACAGHRKRIPEPTAPHGTRLQGMAARSVRTRSKRQTARWNGDMFHILRHLFCFIPFVGVGNARRDDSACGTFPIPPARHFNDGGDSPLLFYPLRWVGSAHCDEFAFGALPICLHGSGSCCRT